MSYYRIEQQLVAINKQLQTVTKLLQSIRDLEMRRQQNELEARYRAIATALAEMGVV